MMSSLSARAIIASGVIVFALLCGLCISQHGDKLLEIRGAHAAVQAWKSAPPLVLRYVQRTLAVSGAVPDSTTRDQLLQRAREVYGQSNVVDQLRIEPRAVPEDWAETVQSLILVAGKKLENGVLKLEQLSLRATGSLADETTKQTLLTGFAALLPEYAVIEDQLVTLEPSAAEIEETQVQLTRLTQRNAIEFDHLSPVLRRTSHRVLDQVVALLARNPRIAIVIEAHTSSYAVPRLDLSLSQQRAEAVRRYLLIHGVDAQRVTARGYGSSRPLLRANTLAAKLKNRRVEFRVVEPG